MQGLVAGRGAPHAHRRRIAVRLAARPGRGRPVEGGRERRGCRHPDHARRRGRDPAPELRRLRARPRDPRRPARALRRHPRTRPCPPVPPRALAAPARHLAGHRLRPRRPRRHRRARRPRVAVRPLASPRSCAAPSRAARCCPPAPRRRTPRSRASRTSSRRSRAGSTSSPRTRRPACPRPTASPRPCGAAAPSAVPAERALGSLVGLELRPRRMREAAAMWRAVTDAVGVAARDALWDYPDLMPTADDIDDPAALVARLEARARGEEPAPDEMDDALARLLAGESRTADADARRRIRSGDATHRTTRERASPGGSPTRSSGLPRLLPRRADRGAAGRDVCGNRGGRADSSAQSGDAPTGSRPPAAVAQRHDAAVRRRCRRRRATIPRRGSSDSCTSSRAASPTTPSSWSPPPSARRTMRRGAFVRRIRRALAAARARQASPLTVQVPTGFPRARSPTPSRARWPRRGSRSPSTAWCDAPDERVPRCRARRRRSRSTSSIRGAPRRSWRSDIPHLPVVFTGTRRRGRPLRAARGAPRAWHASPRTAATPTRRGRSSPRS